MNAVYLGDKPTKTGAVVNADEIPLLDSQDLSSGRKKVKKVTAANLKSSIGGVQSVVAGSGVSVNNADPANPIISASGGGGGGGSTKYKSITLTPTQVKSGQLIQLLPNPGSGKLIILHYVGLNMVANSVNFNAGGPARFILGTSSTSYAPVEVPQGLINRTECASPTPGGCSALQYPIGVQANYLSYSTPQPLNFGFFPGQTPTNGDSSIEIIIAYSIADLEV